MEIKSKFLCSKGVALAFAMLLGGSPGVLLYAAEKQVPVAEFQQLAVLLLMEGHDPAACVNPDAP